MAAHDDVTATISDIARMQPGVVRTRAAEDMVARVEADGPQEAVAFALNTLVSSYVLMDEHGKAFAPFTRAVRLWDSRPELFDEVDRYDLLWSFKWMTSGLRGFPGVPASQIEATLRDMADRYASAGAGPNAVRLSEFLWARHRGAPDVEARFQAWRSTPRDEFSHCEACEPHVIAEHLRATGALDDAAALLERTVATDVSCAEEPAAMLATLALCHVERGDARAATSAFHRATSSLGDVLGDPPGLRTTLLEVVARSGDHERTIARLEDDRRLLGDVPIPADAFAHLLAVVRATGVLERAGLAHRALDVRPVAARTVGELREHVLSAAAALAAAFDARNGTPRHAEQLRDAAEEPLETLPLDLTVVDVQALLGHGLPSGDPQASAPPAAAAVPAPDAPTPESSWQEAEHAAEAGDHAAAARAYVEASRAAESAGRPADAGLALAEAAEHARILEDDAGSAAAFGRSLALLRAGEGDLGVRTQVALAASELTGRVDGETLARIRTECDALEEECTAVTALAGDGSVSRAPRGEQARLVAARIARCRALLATGSPEAARDLASQSAEELRFRRPEAAAMHEVAGRACLVTGDVDEARSHLGAALELLASEEKASRRSVAITALLATIGEPDEV